MTNNRTLIQLVMKQFRTCVLGLLLTLAGIIGAQASSHQTTIGNLTPNNEKEEAPTATKGEHRQSGKCSVYYPYRQGALLEYTFYDRKDKITGSMQQRVKEIKNTAKGMNIEVQSRHFDKKGEEVVYGELTMRCEGSTFYVDLRSMVDPRSMQASEEGQKWKYRVSI